MKMRLASIAIALVLVRTEVAGAQIGTPFCTSIPNSTGFPSVVSGSGTAVVPWNHLVLTASYLPPDAPCYFLCSTSVGFTPNPGGGVGVLCLGAPIGRVVGGQVLRADPLGLASVRVDLNSLPQPTGPIAALPGETWHFQLWYRDMFGAGTTTNFSAGLRVPLIPEPALVPGMVSIPLGSFMMGSTFHLNPPFQGEQFERPVHLVTLTREFWMSRYEVTQTEFIDLMGFNPTPGSGALRPVERMSWVDAVEYCRRLTVRERARGAVPPGYEYRLPTEAEWEYCCRAGTTTEFSTGEVLDCADANIGGNSAASTPCGNSVAVPVGSYPPNAFGLHDMHGNVWEWCLDKHWVYPEGPVTDPFNSQGTRRIIRGGGSGTWSIHCRSARRSALNPWDYSSSVGFRVVLGPIIVP